MAGIKQLKEVKTCSNQRVEWLWMIWDILGSIIPPALRHTKCHEKKCNFSNPAVDSTGLKALALDGGCRGCGTGRVQSYQEAPSKRLAWSQ